MVAVCGAYCLCWGTWRRARNFLFSGVPLHLTFVVQSYVQMFVRRVSLHASNVDVRKCAITNAGEALSSGLADRVSLVSVMG